MFPFLKGAAEYAKISIDSLADECNKIDNYLYDIFSKRFHESETDIEVTMKLFIGSILVVNQIRKQRLIHKFAEVEAANYILRLQNIHSTRPKEFVMYFSMIFEDVFGEPNYVKKSGLKYVLRVPQYLQIWSKCGDKQNLKLIHQTIARGHVIFDTYTLFELLRGGIKAFMVKKIESLNIVTDVDVKKRKLKLSKFHPPVTLPECIKNLVQKYEYIDIYSSAYRTVNGLENKKDFDTGQLIEGLAKRGNRVTPPCIKSVLYKFENGKDVSHYERLTLATFLITKETPLEEILEIFSKAPNYKEKVTRYQLNQIKNAGYKIPGCEKIKDSGFCFRDIECGNIKNPIQLLT